MPETVETSPRRRPHPWRWAALLVVGATGVVAGAVYLAYSRDLQATRDRITAGSRIIQTRHGAVEVAALGAGPPVLVIHGAGGGYDQGLLIASAFGGESFHWIVPSRFGYLRTPLPTDASPVAQAEAHADLLDSLGVERVAILAMSGGVPSALQFAALYPERTSALALLSSAPYTPLTASEQKLPVPIWVYQALFSTDFPLWLLNKIAPRQLDPMFDVSPALRAALSPEEQSMVTRMIDAFQPVTWRVDGLGNEGAAVDPGLRYPLDEISAPTLVVHAMDDHINPFRFGEYTTEHIRGAELLRLATGGHLLLGHQAEVRERVKAHLSRNTVPAQP